MAKAHDPLPAGVDPCDLPAHGHKALRLEEARARIVADITPIEERETVRIHDSLGRVLATAVHSGVDVPSHRNSAMDGYALAGEDLPRSGTATVEIAGTSWAGRPYDGVVRRGQCVRIMTGAMLPDGTDTVVMQEHVRLHDARVSIEPGHRVGQNVRPVGEDIRRGELALEAGTLLRPAQAGLLASLGIGEVTVLRRPRVAIFSTGDELRSIGDALGPGQIYDSNRYSLHGMLTRLQVEVLDLGVVKDTREDTLRAFQSAAERADAVVTSGGVSVGEADYVTETLERYGQVGFWKVAMKPGKPIAFGRFGKACFFGLPGNPVSVMVTFYQFVREALMVLQGRRDAGPVPTFKAKLAAPIRKAPGRTEFQRGILAQADDGGWTVRTTGDQGSGILSSMSQANCFIVLPTATGDVAAGELVDVQLLEGLI